MSIADCALEGLRAYVRGEVLQEGEAGYDEARSVWNGMVDRRPAVIVRCSGTADVVAAVDFARDHDLLLSVHGGGHNVAGKAVCDDFDHEAQIHGLTTTGGVVSSTGVSGLTLGGGIGHLTRT